MSLAELFSAFDQGVLAASNEFEHNAKDTKDIGIGKAFANFTFYDRSVTDIDIPPDSSAYRCLDDSKIQPILWKHLHRTFAQLLRSETDIKESYSGFATLFTLNRDAIGGESRYPSMTIDCDLKSKGFRDLILSKKQFIKRDTIPLTAACLGHADDTNFAATPIIFHWTRPGCDIPDPDPSAIEELRLWGHVHVNAAIPYNSKTGIETDLNKVDFRVQDSPLVSVGDNPIAGSTVRFDEREFYRRLQLHTGSKTVGNLDLAKRITWTVTYFAYACELYLGRILDHLMIVCAPASYQEHVSSALYIPLHRQLSSSRASIEANKVLYLARALASPLWRVHQLSVARREGELEATSAHLHQIPKDFGALDKRLAILRNNAELTNVTVADLRPLIPDSHAIAILIMEADAATRRPSYQLLPTEFPGALQSAGCSLSLVNKIFKLLIVPYMNQRVTNEDITKSPSFDVFELSEEELANSFPTPRIRDFDTFQIPDGRDAYIWFLLALRNAAIHAYLPVVAGKEKTPGAITINYTRKTQTLTISNTGFPPISHESFQYGWVRDIELYERKGQHWKVLNHDQGVFSKWSQSDRVWITTLGHVS